MRQVAEPLTQPSGDYYSRRAEKILEKAAAGDDNKPHPLAKTYPEDFVIVCEAGCRERRAAIVSREPREAVKVVEGGRLVTLSADGDATSGTPDNILVCLAGCRPGSVVIPSAPPQISEPYVPVSSMTHPAADEFKTTVGPESGRWLSGAGEDNTKTN